MNDIRKWKNKLEGTPAFILGNGYSIKDKDLSQLDPYFTIGVNRILYKYDPTILLWQDLSLFNDVSEEDIKETKAIKVSTKESDLYDISYHFELLKFVRLGSKVVNYQFATNPDKLYRYANSGMLAIQMAKAMGCSCLILLGIDGKYDGDETDFYGKNEDHNEETLSNFNRSLKILRQNKIMPIFNCSDNDFWPKIKLEDVIEKINPTKRRRKYFNSILLRK
jgi:hypothetical protein